MFEDSKAYKLEYDGKKTKKTSLEGTGDFRSDECREILKHSDIVVTNPPFSLFREFVDHLIKHRKKFMIIGNLNAVSYRDIFPVIQADKLWLGCSIKSGDREFRVPDDYPLKAAGHRVDENGHKYIRVKGVRWFTNLPHDDRNTPIDLWKKYTPEEYPVYDNYEAIEVGRLKDIPKDYDDVMGVPITFMDRYNPSQFEIVGLCRYLNGDAVLNGKNMYQRIIVKRK